MSEWESESKTEGVLCTAQKRSRAFFQTQIQSRKKTNNNNNSNGKMKRNKK